MLIRTHIIPWTRWVCCKGWIPKSLPNDEIILFVCWCCRDVMWTAELDGMSCEQHIAACECWLLWSYWIV